MIGWSQPSFGSGLSYLESQLLRQSMSIGLMEWIIPFDEYRRPCKTRLVTAKKCPPRTDYSYFNQPQVADVYKKAQSKDSKKIRALVAKNYGKVYHNGARIQTSSFISENWYSSFASTASAWLFIDNPVFPNFYGRMVQDFVWTFQDLIQKP